MNSKTSSFVINGCKIGQDAPPYIIAEMSGNHNGDINHALDILIAAKKAGANAVKLQTYTADTLTIDHDSSDFIIKGGLWDKRKLYDLYDEAHTPWDWHPILFDKAKELDLTIFSTPFDETAVDFLENLKAPLYKIASFEMLDIPLLKKVAATQKPIIMSTGMANLDEITIAVDCLRQITDQPIVLLHCISSYPAPIEQSNLRTIQELADRFDVIAGLSDHTLGNVAAITASALGAKVIEKHFTLSRQNKGPDSAFSLEPDELADLVISCKQAHSAIGAPTFERAPAEEASLTFRRSIYIVKDIAKGEPLSTENTRIIRPGFGLSPTNYEKVLTMTAVRDLKRGEALEWDMIS